MDIIQSRIEQRKDRLINQCETLNQNIFHLQTIESKTKENLKQLEKNKGEFEITLGKMDKAYRKRKEDFKKTKDIMECSICMENKIDCVLVPCGHMYCSKCIVGVDVCPHCRNSFQKIQKLFFI